MKTPNFNQKKAVATVLYVASKLSWANFHKVIKIIYFADLKHLAAYGTPITGDRYIAMKNGPVASWILDLLHHNTGREFWKFFTVRFNYFIFPTIPKSLMDHFSESDIKCLDESISENKHLTFRQLCDKSHDHAWTKTQRDREIKMQDIIEVSGASKKMREYIDEMEGNKTFKIA